MLTWKSFRERLLDPKNIKYRYVYKDDHWLHQLIGWFLTVTGITRDYMKSFVTVFWGLFAIPSNSTEQMWPSVETEEMHIDAVRTHSHERVHTFQSRRYWIRLIFYARYIFSKKWRATYEGEAYGTSMYVDFRAGRRPERWPSFIEEVLASKYGIPRKLAFDEAVKASRLLDRFNEGYVRPVDEDLAEFLDQVYPRS